MLVIGWTSIYSHTLLRNAVSALSTCPWTRVSAWSQISGCSSRQHSMQFGQSWVSEPLHEPRMKQPASLTFQYEMKGWGVSIKSKSTHWKHRVNFSLGFLNLCVSPNHDSIFEQELKCSVQHFLRRKARFTKVLVARNFIIFWHSPI